MRDRWSDEDARAAVDLWGQDWGEAVALRTYTSRLIGADPGLVLHGGGNTSVKASATDELGEARPALYVKGSGWDLAQLEPEGLPAVDLDWIRRLRSLDALSDEAMVNAIRTHQFDASAPRPSIETLLHAFLPHPFVDHSHADAILAVTNTVGGEAVVVEALGADVAIVPYVKAGFDLAKLAAEVYDAHPECIGLVLMHHGLFTFGDSARESYQRHIEVVSRAQEYLRRAATLTTLQPPGRVDTEAQAAARARSLLPVLRGALATREGGEWTRWVLDWRGTDDVLTAVNDDFTVEQATYGPITPDHVIRTKPRPLVLEIDTDQDAASWRETIEDAMRAFRAEYDAYFEACASRAGGVGAYTKLDSTPRVVLVPGVGLIGVGDSPKAARIAADIAEHTVVTKLSSYAVGSWKGLSDDQLFEMEYWSLEQAKLAGRVEKPLSRRIAVVTGGAGAIGIGVARQLLAEGASVALADIDRVALARAVDALGGERETLMVVSMDVSDPDATERGFARVVARWGGVDLVVVNAGIAAAGKIDRMAVEDFDRLVQVNLRGAWNTLAQAARTLKAQGTGGGIVVVSTKNVAAPGAEFGAYSATKAGAHQLARIAALELAEHGIRVNLVAPDAVFHDGDVPSGLWETVGPERARSRGMSAEQLPEYYRERNLLKTTVSATHVGRAVCFLASEQTPTTGAVLPVDGGLPGAFPR